MCACVFELNHPNFRNTSDRFGVEPELTDEIVGLYRCEWAFSSARAERELGYRITPFEEALAQSVAWMRATGRLPESVPRGEP